MTSNDDRRQRSYRVGGRISRERIARESPDDHLALEAVQRSDIVVVSDVYDHVEWVLEALDLPYSAVGTHQVGALRLRPEQLLVVNCPGQIDHRGISTVRRFVAGGGSLFTTDWALRNVVEEAFPGLVAFNQKPTADAVVRVEITDHDNPFLKGVMDEGDDPVWWLEGSSYPIRILDAERVEVLIRSRELADQWGEEAVAVTFPYGEGEVFHMISHYYLQRTETRTRRHARSAASYAAEKGVDLDEATAAAAADLDLSEVESASSSARMMANLIAEKKKRHQASQRSR